jgi:hypothetical protein
MIDTKDKTIILYAGHGKGLVRSIGFKDLNKLKESNELTFDYDTDAQSIIDNCND